MYNNHRKRRLRLVFLTFVIALLLLTSRLAYVQLIDGPRLAVQAVHQSTLEISLEQACRGNIYDRNGENMTSGQVVRKVAIFPQLISKQQQLIARLSPILNMTSQSLTALWPAEAGLLSTEITADQARLINELGEAGCLAVTYKTRYGEESLADHVLGYLGKIDSQNELKLLQTAADNKYYTLADSVGKSGIEKYYEEYLKGNQPKECLQAFIDASGRLINRSGAGLSWIRNAADESRNSVVLTIDAAIQQAVEQIMDTKISKGAVVVMEAGSGEILAMASRPAYDSAAPDAAGAADEAFLNRACCLYQPGSVFKIITAAAVLEEELVDASDMYYCGGKNSVLIADYTDHGYLSFAEAFAASCNSVFVQLGDMLGADKLIQYAERLGMGNQKITGYTYQPDSRQQLALIAQPHNLINSAIGQGPILATPVQITAMLNTIVNDGCYQQPSLVQKIVAADGSIVRQLPEAASVRVISARTAAALSDLLKNAVSAGTGYAAAAANVACAGKTGSAEVSDVNDSVNAWFAGFAPADDPQYIITVLVENGESGAVTAAPIFREIVEAIL